MEYKIALCVVEMSMHTLLKILGVWFHKTYKYSISVEAYHLILIAAGQKKITAVFVIWDVWFISLPIYTFHKTYITLFVNVEKIIILL